MQQVYFTLCLLLFTGMGFAQDTIRVQTFTWEDNTRSKTFQFPDNPDDTYEQILMRYNMRCHDAAIRTDNRGGIFGCGECDYSCNTFIYDPSRLDSVKTSHPSHRISGFEGEEFYYRNDPIYAYYDFTQYETTFADTTSLLVAELGEAVTPDYRLDGQGDRFRRQYLYHAEELQAQGLSAGPLTALQLNLTEGAATLPHLRLRLKAVDREELSENEPEFQDFTTVYFRTTELTADGWHRFPFYQPFVWDGSSDLLVDVSAEVPEENSSLFHTLDDTDFPSSLSCIGTFDHYLALNGNGWMDIDHAADEPLEAITIAFWAKGQSAAVGRSTSVLEAVDAENRRQLNVHLPWSNNRIYWDCGNDGTGYDRIDKAADPSVLAGEWNFWAFTKDASTGEMAIYLNGELWHSGTGMFRTIDLDRTVFGANANYGNRWPGGLDQISIWHTALTAAEIQQIMFEEAIRPDHPAHFDLAAYYSLDEGTGLVATDFLGSANGRLFGPNWQRQAARDLRTSWSRVYQRWHLRFEQGEHTVNNTAITVRDSQQVSPVTVRTYAVDARNDLQFTGEYEAYPSDTYVYDENGNAIELIPLEEDGTIAIETLDYHRKQPAKFEILSLVTPYGIQLDLGPEGKTFTFDVTDYAPILRGEKRLSLELGGENQEEMDIEFLFIKGTPAREVKDIANVWPFARGWYEPIQQDAIFEPRNLRLDPTADSYKLRASVTGHGQNGEFQPRQHYLNLNGGPQDFRFDVWKECGDNPVYPQGGTWVFDRAGWCPGMATDVHEFFLPAGIGTEVEVDYGVNGSFLSEANYLVSAQLVTYGPRNFELDARLVDIIRPSTRVEYERFNPTCDDPLIRVRNTGGQAITSLRIEYGTTGGSPLSYDWTGNLAPDAEVEIALPVDDYHFWTDSEEGARFEVTLAAVNGTVDDYQPNNRQLTDFVQTDIFDFEQPLVLWFTSNLRPAENSYTITNSQGEVVMERSDFAASTRYLETIDLPAGCYRLTFFDDGDDGLDFWYWGAIGQSRGTGNLSMRRQIRPTLLTIEHLFDPDFGGDLYYDFVIPGLVNDTEEVEQAQRFSVYPNPARSYTQLELTGFAGETAYWSLHNTQGVAVAQGKQRVQAATETLQVDLDRLPAGLYLAKVRVGEQWYTRELVVLP
jgi:hypothetical protein